MKPFWLKVISLNLLLLSSAPSWGAVDKRSNITFDDTVNQEGMALQLTGTGVRTAILGIKVYAMAHYLQPGASQAEADANKRIVMHFLREVAGEKIVGSYKDSLEQNNSSVFENTATHTALKPHIDSFLKAVNHTVNPGETLELHYLPKKGLKVVSGGQISTINSPQVAQMVWNIWFGPNPPSPGKKLKESLISLLK